MSVPELTAEDLKRNAEADYEEESRFIHANRIGLAWIRRCVSAERRAVEAERQRDELRAAIADRDWQQHRIEVEEVAALLTDDLEPRLLKTSQAFRKAYDLLLTSYASILEGRQELKQRARTAESERDALAARLAVIEAYGPELVDKAGLELKEDLLEAIHGKGE